MATPIPLIGVSQQQPTFPQMNINVNEEGMQLKIIHAPGYSSDIAFGPDMVEQISQEWARIKQCLVQESLIIQDVQRSKNG